MHEQRLLLCLCASCAPKHRYVKVENDEIHVRILLRLEVLQQKSEEFCEAVDFRTTFLSISSQRQHGPEKEAYIIQKPLVW